MDYLQQMHYFNDGNNTQYNQGNYGSNNKMLINDIT